MCRRRERDLSPACERCRADEISVLVDGRRRECRVCLGVSNVENDDPSQCQSCPAGFLIRRGNSEFCLFNFFPSLQCPVGQTPSRGDMRGFCVGCRAGTYMLRENGPCQSCRFGFGFGGTSLGISPAGCRVEGRGCPTNTFQGSDGECRACRRGERLNRRRMVCVNCPRGQVSVGGVGTRCLRCPSGKVANGARSGCVCRPGTISDGEGGCLECPRGTAWTTNGAIGRPGDFTDVSSCQICFRGTVQNQTGSEHCDSCPEDSVPNQDRTACEPCPSGFRNPLHLGRADRVDESRQQCLDEDQCPPGFSRIDGMFRGLCAQEECGEGQFREFLTGSTCTSSCPRGFRYDPGRGRCIDCGRLRTSDGGLSTNCRRCPRRSENSFDLGCECIDGTGIQNGRCLPCPAGSISRAFGPPINNRKCLKCPPGRFQPTSGSNGLHNVCMRCPTNSTTPMEGGASECTPCPPGMVVFTGRDGNSENVCRFPFPPPS